tara:strand:+ start:60 stop:506 length:447 start_codon:yes stop_codon:yes gene_type:complete
MKRLLLLFFLPICCLSQNMKLGDIYQGGIIFYLSTNKQHGLICSTNNNKPADWFEAIDMVSNPKHHSIMGKNYTDWRLPTKFELNELYRNKEMIDSVSLHNDGEAFENTFYWSATDADYDYAWRQNFKNGKHGKGRRHAGNIRAVRSF